MQPKVPYIDGYITAQQAARKFGVDEQTIRNWVKDGKIEGLVKEYGGKNAIYVKDDAIAPPPHSSGRVRGEDLSQFPRCPANSCFLNRNGRCLGCTECLYKEHDKPKDGKTLYCVFYKPKKEVNHK